jgi:hypothetical protein
MTNKLVRANIQKYTSHSFDEYGDPNPVYELMVNGKKLTLKTRGKKLPSSFDFSQKYEFIFEVTPSNEIVAFYSPLQDSKWGSQSNIRTLTGSSRKPKVVYQFISGTISDKSSKSEIFNTHQPKFGMESATLEKRTTYFINVGGRSLQGSSSYKKVKVGDQVTGVTNQYGYLEMLKNKQTGKVYGLFPIWPMLIALVATVAINIFLFMNESLNEPVKTVFGEFPEYYEKVVFFNLVAIPMSIMTIIWSKERFRILSFHRENNK